jgi:hypothetical protein
MAILAPFGSIFHRFSGAAGVLRQRGDGGRGRGRRGAAAAVHHPLRHVLGALEGAATMRLDLSGLLSRKRLAFSIQAL